MDFTIKKWNGFDIAVRQDRYIRLTDMAQACKKQVNDYLRLKSTKSSLDILEKVLEIPQSEILQVTKGGDTSLTGTWGHPNFAIMFAQWCDPSFAVQVSIWVDEFILSGFNPTASPKDKSGFVYLASGLNGNHKIGMSKQPLKRMASLQTGNATEIVLVHRVFSFDCPALEKALHDHYQRSWIRGEWYELSSEQVVNFPSVAAELDRKIEGKLLT